MGEDLFPVLFIACSNLRGASTPAEISRERIFDVIGFSLVSPEDNTRVKLSVAGGNVLKKNVEETLVLSKGQECVVFPQLAWDYQALSQVKQLYPLDIVFQVEVNGLVSDLYTRTVRLHSINDCPLRYVDDGGKVHDLSWVLAAYINEGHPQIVQLRAEARKYCRGFSGYQRAEPGDVDQQVLAFWNALHRRGVKYTSTRPTSLASDRVFSQHVSLVDEILQNSQGNCVDGSILLASALMNISVDAAIILLPGHCLLGYWADREHKQPLRALETTLLGAGDLNDFRQRGIRLPEGEIENFKNELAQQSFKAAWERGSQILREHSEDFQKGKEGYLVLDIRKARQQGVAPIPSLASTYANPW